MNPPPPRRSVVCADHDSRQVHILLLAGLAVIVVLALVSPLESLRWWAGQSDEAVALAAPQSAAQLAVPAALENAHWVVWLSGIGSVPGQTEDPFEVRFLQELRDRVPNVVIVDDAFAYSVRDNPLAGKQLLDAVLRSGARAWRLAKPACCWAPPFNSATRSRSRYRQMADMARSSTSDWPKRWASDSSRAVTSSAAATRSRSSATAVAGRFPSAARAI